MKATIIAVSVAALIAAAPGVLAKKVSSETRDQQRHASEQHGRVVSVHVPRHAMHAKGLKTGYPNAFGYAPGQPEDHALESSRLAGGGGGGGGGGM